jgi:hypothetical protein
MVVFHQWVLIFHVARLALVNTINYLFCNKLPIRSCADAVFYNVVMFVWWLKI